MKKINLACVIDDDPTHIFITKTYLQMIDSIKSIIICSNGKDAYDKLQLIASSGQQLPELILLDLNMPIWDGWQFLDEFKKIPTEQSIRIYILTSSVSSDDFKRAEEYNMQSNYIVKPVTLDTLKEVLSELFEEDE